MEKRELPEMANEATDELKRAPMLLRAHSKGTICRCTANLAWNIVFVK